MSIVDYRLNPIFQSGAGAPQSKTWRCFNAPLAISAVLFIVTSLSAADLSVPLTITENAGVARSREIVTSGIPFPRGSLRTNESIALIDSNGTQIPLQTEVTGTWPDGSIKWLLLDFPASIGKGERQNFTLRTTTGASAITSPSVQIENGPTTLWINTGPLKFSIARNTFSIFDRAYLDANGDGAFTENESLLAGGLGQSLTVTEYPDGNDTTILAPDETILEENGPHRAVIKVAGWITDGSTNKLVRYQFRIHAFAGSAAVKLFYTVTQLSSAKMLWVRDLSLLLKPALNGNPKAIIGGIGEQLALGRGSANMTQLRESRFSVRHAGSTLPGFKAPGWLDVAGTNAGIFLDVRDFWEQFPKAMTASTNGVRIALYPAEAEKPLDMDQGLAKTHELLIDFHAGSRSAEQCEAAHSAFQHALFAIAPSKWYGDSKVFGDLWPFDFDRFPDYETLTEASGDQFIRKMATNIRNWGDVYYGGEYKGTNSYMNLEYDVHHNFYCQFARTGLRKYLDTAVAMAMHQADIDTNHKTGWQWKHSPRHVEIQAEFGHTFTRGLLETWFLTGNRRCREAALELADYFTKQIRNPRELGNERQIGWSLISLLPAYEATWDKKYFDAAHDTIERLLAGLDDRGKFNIRWDNRISFFNGIAATGFIYYYRATGDERVAEAALKVIRRTKGFYPEYAGRTLEAIAWAYERTKDPEYLDLLARTWEATLAKVISWNVMELGAPTIFTVHALPFMATSGFIPQADHPLNLTPEQFSSENGLHVRHLPNGDADLYMDFDSTAPIDLAIIRKGAWKDSGQATLYDPTGKPVFTLDYPKDKVIWQRQFRSFLWVPDAPSLRPPVKGTYRLALRSSSPANVKGGSFITWDVATSRPIRSVFEIPGWKNLEFVTPSLFTVAKADADKIEIEFSAEGEGFKKASLFDPSGNLAGVTEAFIDLGDKSRYSYKLTALIQRQNQAGLWRLSLQDLTITKLTGLAPYFSTTTNAFFVPAR